MSLTTVLILATSASAIEIISPKVDLDALLVNMNSATQKYVALETK